jgi:hypothetical protein
MNYWLEFLYCFMYFINLVTLKKIYWINDKNIINMKNMEDDQFVK